MRAWRRWALALVVGIGLTAACSSTDRTAPDDASTTAPSSRPSGDQALEATRAAAQQFLAAYVEPDGRVARRDQGGDTVSEGQAYALLLAQVAGDEAAFARIWEWTATHLLQPNGLPAAHAGADGTVDDTDAASDADVLLAWALARDAGPDAAAHHEAAAELAAAILAGETVTLPDGRLVLTAGTWATGEVATLNPSYWALPALDDLAELTGDDRWEELADTSVDLVAEQTDDGERLPADWLALADGAVSATPSPNGDVAEARYSLDAQRVVIWFAASDRSDAVDLASRWTALLGEEAGGAIALGLDGTIIDPTPHPVGLIAAAAAAAADDDSTARDAILGEAVALDEAQPTYYGEAWVALGRALLTTEALGETSQPR